jgi:regulator of replication initiation timing
MDKTQKQLNPKQEKPTQTPQVSPKVAQEMQLLNLRIKDMMTQMNSVFEALVEENTALQLKVTELQCPVKTQVEREVK